MITVKISLLLALIDILGYVQCVEQNAVATKPIDKLVSRDGGASSNSGSQAGGYADEDSDWISDLNGVGGGGPSPDSAWAGDTSPPVYPKPQPVYQQQQTQPTTYQNAQPIVYRKAPPQYQSRPPVYQQKQQQQAYQSPPQYAAPKPAYQSPPEHPDPPPAYQQPQPQPEYENQVDEYQAPASPKYQTKTNANTNQNGNAYGGPALSNLVAQVIPASSNTPQTLAEKYPTNQLMLQQNTAASSAYQYVQQQQQSQNPQNTALTVLLYLKFASQFDQWNPRRNGSLFQFLSANAVDYEPADNAAIVVVGSNSGHNAYGGGGGGRNGQSSSLYGGGGGGGGGGSRYSQSSENGGYVKLYSAPFNNFREQDEAGVEESYDEGFVQSVATYAIGATERLLVRMKSSCEILNADDHPFTAEQVSKPWDDPRLASCSAPYLADPNNDYFLYFLITNTGVWAVYSRFPNGETQTGLYFIAKRRVGIRPRYDSIVDAAIEIDNRQGVINYYLNGYVVWTINAVGFLPPADGVSQIDVGSGTPTLIRPTSVSVRFGTQKCLDESDPNNRNSLARLVAILPLDSPYYSANSTFYYPVSTRANNIWGQGAIQTLIKLLVVRGESVLTPPPAPLPGVYGGSQASSQQQQAGYGGSSGGGGGDEYEKS